MDVIPLPYIEFDSNGRARIAGTRFKIRILGELHAHGGMSVAELVENYPDLSLAQIHAGLAYYFAHKTKFDEEIEALRQQADAYHAANPLPPALAEKLQAARLAKANLGSTG